MEVFWEFRDLKSYVVPIFLAESFCSIWKEIQLLMGSYWKN
jgi:hypothetical protein